MTSEPHEDEAVPSDPPATSRRRGTGRPQQVALIVFLALLFGVGGALFAFLRSTDYTASTLIQISATEVTATPNGDTLDDADIATERLVMDSDVVAQKVVSALQLPDSAQKLQNAVVVEQVNDSQVLRLTATWNSPDGAAAVANAFAKQYLEYRNSMRDQRLAEIGDTGADGLKPASGGQIITPATATHRPAGLRPVVLIVLTGLLGAVVGLMVVFFQESRRASRRTT